TARAVDVLVPEERQVDVPHDLPALDRVGQAGVEEVDARVVGDAEVRERLARRLAARGGRGGVVVAAAASAAASCRDQREASDDGRGDQPLPSLLAVQVVPPGLAFRCRGAETT